MRTTTIGRKRWPHVAAATVLSLALTLVTFGGTAPAALADQPDPTGSRSVAAGLAATQVETSGAPATEPPAQDRATEKEENQQSPASDVVPGDSAAEEDEGPDAPAPEDPTENPGAAEDDTPDASAPEDATASGAAEDDENSGAPVPEDAAEKPDSVGTAARVTDSQPESVENGNPPAAPQDALSLPEDKAPTTSAADYPPLIHPAGQSTQPAPASRQKRVIENVHTDAVSAYLDNGTLVAQTKADIDVDQNGSVDLGTRLTTSELLFHVSDVAKIQIPDVPGFGFLGAPGETIWMAPMVQNPQVIWPGFSTEDPNLRGKTSALDVSLIGFTGPGRAEVFMAADNRVFSSTTPLPAWRMGVPQHTHMNWAFTQPGSYTFTFQLSGQVDGRQQVAQNNYTFVVGDLSKHTKQTSVAIEASSASLGQGEPVLFTATVQPADAIGAVQFRDLSSGTLLGHTPVTGGRAQFVADALNPGTRQIAAEFVPTWSSDLTPSVSAPVNLTVEGEVRQRPTYSDTQPVPAAELNAHRPGSVVEVTSVNMKATTGTAVTARVKSAALAGHWLSAWLPGQSPAWRGWVQTDPSGAFSLELGGTSQRSQQLVVKDADGRFVGWDQFEIVAPPGPGGSGGNSSPGGSGDNDPDGSGGGSPGGSDGGDSGNSGDTGGKAKAPSTQTCKPGVTLDRGHIDAFYVSAAGGQAVLQLMEDVTGHHVIREAETVLLKVKESALGTVGGAPKGTPSKGYVLPLTQRSDLVWPGWDTNRTSSSGYSDVSIMVTRVQGPGTVSLYTQGDWGAWAPILTSKSYKFPGTIREPRPVHTHAQWVFSKKGIYKLTAHAVATNPSTGRSIRTASHTYTFQVGNVPLGDAFCGLSTKGAASAKKVNAAVNQAATTALEDARAAQQAEAEAAGQGAVPTTPQVNDPRATPGTQPFRQEDDVLPETAGGDPTLLAGLIGLGSGLLIAGIAAGTVWYARRLRRIGPTANVPA